MRKACLLLGTIQLKIAMTQLWGSVSSACMVMMSTIVSCFKDGMINMGFLAKERNMLDFCDGILHVDVFKNFLKDGDFYCYQGESNKSTTSMFSLYRASQVSFPGEDELSQAEIYCREFLNHRRASHKLTDKWVIPKDLPGEVLPNHFIASYN